MFKGFKNIVKGGISTVTEKGSDIAGSVVGDPDLGTTGIKNKFKDARSQLKGEGKLGQFVSEGADDIADKVGEARIEDGKDLVKDAAHNAKHYGAFGENFLGYTDPTKDLRKAVKAKEKAAKKAKKAKKKKGEKEEDLFDPANLAKYKAELEEKKRQAEAAAEPSAGPETATPEADKSKDASPVKSSGSPDFTRRESVNSWGAPQGKAKSPDFDFGQSPPQQKSPEKKPANDDGDWRSQLNNLTGGIDHLLKEKKDNLEQIKVESYYQRKKTGDEIAEDARVARPKTLVGKRKKKWADLNNDEFEEYDGEIPIVLSDGNNSDDSEEDVGKVETKEPTPVEEEKKESDQETKEEEGEEDSEQVDDDDFFSTKFADETLAADVKLAVIPDSPEEEEDDIFDTKYADVIVQKADKERKAVEKKESNKIKFGGLANAADVLTGKGEVADKTNVQQAVKSRRRRDYRINLIADKAEDVSVTENSDASSKQQEDKTKLDIFELSDAEGQLAPVPDLLSGTPSAPISSINETGELNEQHISEDLKEFDVVLSEEAAPTDNVALIAAKLDEEPEEDDPFDALFDDLAKESANKDKLAQLEEDLFNDDLFDTTAADDVLNLASLTKLQEKKEDEAIVLDDFEDKDPFDTTAYEHITADLEDDLEFASLAAREIDETVDLSKVATDLGPKASDPFEVLDKQLAAQKFADEEGGWGAFDTKVERKKPARPPPRRPPPPPRPAPPPVPPKVQVDYASGRTTPSVIVKAPSSESIKSWNVTQAEELRLKCNIEAIEASALEDDDQEEDPFDTKQFEGIVAELKEKEEDPFDTTAAATIGPCELRQIEKEVLGDNPTKVEDENGDPFETGFAEDLLPNKGDPFSTNHVEEDDFDPFDTAIADKVIPVRSPRISQKSTVSIEDDDFDPGASFKTNKAKPPPPPARPPVAKKEIDPFFTEQEKKPAAAPAPAPVPRRVYKNARQRPQTLQEKQAIAEAERQKELEKQRALEEHISDDDFDPRADTPPPVEEKPKTPETPESPDPFNTDGVDPFDTSGI